MTAPKGVYITTKKDGTVYFRASITYKNKHISLGSYALLEDANAAYKSAGSILNTSSTSLDDYSDATPLPFDKWVILHNYRDSGYYFRSPIYLHKKYFVYYLDMDNYLFFDVDDLFYYSSHPIHRRGGYFFVNDYGMQVNILSRYKIRNHSVEGVDYKFIDHNSMNFRYDNIDVINPYHGVEIETKKNRTLYKARIHINGNYIIGRYKDLTKAAIAYNKAVDHVLTHRISQKAFEKNYILDMKSHEYTAIYNRIQLSKNLLDLTPS